MDTVLEIQDVVKKFASTLAVAGVSCEVRQGEIMGVLGPNGAGKTSLIRMIMDINAPDSGSINFNFQNGSGDNWQESIGYLPEERGLYKNASVKDILAFLGGLKGLEKKVAQNRGKEWLEKFGLLDNYRDKIEELSNGMAQKVQFATCVLHEPELLILDEPFSGLDPVSQDLMKEEIRNLARKGTAIMLSSHQMNLVEEVCDRIFLMDKGSKVLYGDLEDIKNEYGNYRVKLTTADSRRLETFLSNNPRIHSFRQNKINWNILLENEVGPAEFIAILPEDLSITEISITRISLHDIFVRVARGGLLDAEYTKEDL